MATQTFVNLAVQDLAKATEFFKKLGFSFDQQFTSENATRMIVSDDTSVTWNPSSAALSHPARSLTPPRLEK